MAPTHGDTPQEKFARKCTHLRKLRVIIKLIMANLFWLADIDEKLGDNVMKNIQMLTRKKVKKSALTGQEKAILCKPKEERTEEEKALLSRSIGGLKCFKKYPPEVKAQLAACTYYVFYNAGRVIVKQDHPPSAMYFILSGEAAVSVRHYDKVLKEWITIESGTLYPGTMFGEVALLHGVVRLATISTTTPCELLMIKKEDFDRVLKATVLKSWEAISKTMNNLSYFKNWDNLTKRECAIIARTKSYATAETVLGDDIGLPKWVYFITKGSCHIIEHLMLKVYEWRGLKTYSLILYDEDFDEDEDDRTVSQIFDKYNIGGKETLADKKHVGKKKSDELMLSLEKGESKHQKGSKDFTLEHHFIKVCDLGVGACFNIGEPSRRRRVVAKTPTTVLLVPKYWVRRNNKDNIWNRVQQFLTKHIPTSEEIFKNFLEAKKFKKYSHQSGVTP
ncbi:unnamed protein product [Acanthoscelides obtectus]|uniref:Cyclic nucleotide-binding domain-containing protein n=2 Tax=Acanthoscelides obtectus TaxID=200917 RepID=A0A9P0NU63_ACAOB|nr:unnamed protein product [Acanthoscelides obtectus]CAK1665762.1 Cyclic nucleotide-binding domain-containing protein 2 [Acanthoscelides obtectus]